MKLLILSLIAFTAMIFAAHLSAAQSSQSAPVNQSEDLSVKSNSTQRSVKFIDANGKSVGHATLRDEKRGVRITLALTDLKPGMYAMHIHENGKCEGPKFESAGGHFNPSGRKHGTLNPEGSHAGDLPNVEANSRGMITNDVNAPGLSLLKETKMFSLATKTGTSLMIHAHADDMKSDPAGNSGDRVYCAVINEPESAKKTTK